MTARPPTAVLAGALAVGVVAVATSALISRGAYEAIDGGTVGAGMVLAVSRLVVTTGLMAPAWARRPRRLPPGTGGRSVAAGVLLGVHFATWLPSLAFTSVAASATIVTTGPVWVVLIQWMGGERPRLHSTVGIAVAVAGGALVAFGDVDGLDAGSNPLLGNALALVAAITYAGHLLLGRDVQQRGLGLWRWTSVVTAVGAVTVAPVALATGPGDGPYPARFWLAAVGLALVPQVLGHSAFTWCVRWLSPTLVSVVILGEPLLASLGAAWAFGEVPGPLVAVGGAVLLVGVAVTTLAEHDRAPTPATDGVEPL